MSDVENNFEGRESRSQSKSPAGSPACVKSESRSGSRSPSRASKHSESHSQSRSKSRSRSRRHSHRRYTRSRSHSHRRRSRSRSYTPEYRRRRSRSHSPMSNRRRHTGSRVCSANPDPNTCLGVFGLSLYTTERDLREVFSRYGPLSGVNVVYDQRTGRSRGFAFVYFERIDDSKELITILKRKGNSVNFCSHSSMVGIEVSFHFCAYNSLAAVNICSSKVPVFFSSSFSISPKRKTSGFISISIFRIFCIRV
ncbi:transformer-2 protein homolog alpha-like isoform X6 [Pseudonaja textilis]|uniref:transformer-2 protein homolog alpha-like isoform X6 n=1 Tax=Pseudonaja textilis TaxID=8673 RepID=UPI000EAA2AAC|nr:transformer-2 protein homolog alpha-like isoform X6 [Pseudonaja textilis]